MCALGRSLFFRELRGVIAMCGDFPQCVQALNLPTFLFSFNGMAAMWVAPLYAKALRSSQSKDAWAAQARPST
jgi:hypothetical protein